MKTFTRLFGAIAAGCLLLLCAGCQKSTPADAPLPQDCLLYDMGAHTLGDVQSCTVFPDSGSAVILEAAMDREDVRLLEAYRYQQDCPFERFDDLVSPTKSHILNATIGGQSYTLYLTDDGSIYVHLPDEPELRQYQADPAGRITPELYAAIEERCLSR